MQAFLKRRTKGDSSTIGTHYMCGLKANLHNMSTSTKGYRKGSCVYLCLVLNQNEIRFVASTLHFCKITQALLFLSNRHLQFFKYAYGQEEISNFICSMQFACHFIFFISLVYLLTMPPFSQIYQLTCESFCFKDVAMNSIMQELCTTLYINKYST